MILRFEEGGGFVAPGFLASEAPIFTLYGDGTVVFRDPRKDPPPAIGAIHPFRPFQTAVLDGSQIQVLLAAAIEEGGLGTAKPAYTDDHIADAPTATFTLDAGGVRKTVSVYALGIDVAGQPDASPRAGFVKLAERLRGFDGDGAIATKVYEPDRYRGVLLEGGATDPAAKPWPWSDLTPADFVVPTDPNGPRLPTRILTVRPGEGPRPRLLPGRLHRPDPHRPRRQDLRLHPPPAPPRREGLTDPSRPRHSGPRRS